MTTVGERLKAARERKRLKQTEVKERTNINNKTLSGYENNVSQPDFETLKILSDLYEVSIDWLLGNENKKESEYTLPESEYDRVIREVESRYNVNLRDDPTANKMIREIILGLAKMKSENE